MGGTGAGAAGSEVATDPEAAAEAASRVPTGPLVPRRWGRLYLLLELAVVFFLFPILLYFIREDFGEIIISSLVVSSLFCLGLLLADPTFDRRQLWNARDLRRGLRSIASSFLPGALVVALALVLLAPELLFDFARDRPRLWAFVMVFYPVFSVYPQEIIFRTFFFHRYRSIFRDRRWMIAASGVAFGLGHLFFANWIAPTLTVAGGLLFARTYARSRSTLQAVLEHGLWGDFLFTIGLGWYFYGGAIGS